MKNYEEKINEIKEKLDKAKDLQIRAEARLEQLKNQESDILKEMDELGVKPENLDNEINMLSIQIDELIKQIDELIPKDE